MKIRRLVGLFCLERGEVAGIIMPGVYLPAPLKWLSESLQIVDRQRLLCAAFLRIKRSHLLLFLFEAALWCVTRKKFLALFVDLPFVS